MKIQAESKNSLTETWLQLNEPTILESKIQRTFFQAFYDESLSHIGEVLRYELDTQIAELAAFLIKIHNEKELQSLMPIPTYLAQNCEDVYSAAYRGNHTLIAVEDQRFLFPNEDIPKLTETHHSVLSKVAKQGILLNPVYVEFDPSGVLVFD